MYDSLSEQEHASTLSEEGADITQPLLCRERQMENLRFTTHKVKKGQQLLKGGF